MRHPRGKSPGNEGSAERDTFVMHTTHSSPNPVRRSMSRRPAAVGNRPGRGDGALWGGQGLGVRPVSERVNAGSDVDCCYIFINLS